MYNVKVTRMESKISIPLFKVPVGIVFYYNGLSHVLTGDMKEVNGKLELKALAPDRKEVVISNDATVFIVVNDMTACNAYRQNFRYFLMGSTVYEFSRVLAKNGYHITNTETGESSKISFETIIQAFE